MLTQDDYKNLLALLSRAQFNGVGEAMAGVILHDKLTILASAAGAKVSAAEATQVVLGGGDSQDHS